HKRSNAHRLAVLKTQLTLQANISSTLAYLNTQEYRPNNTKMTKDMPVNKGMAFTYAVKYGSGIFPSNRRYKADRTARLIRIASNTKRYNLRNLTNSCSFRTLCVC